MDYLDSMLVAESEWLDLACQSSKENKQVLLDIKENLNQFYDTYNSIIEKDTIKPIVPDFIGKNQKAALIDFYKSPPSLLKEKLQNRRNKDNLLDVCPYCGNRGIPNTLDHFIPKDDYPHYAIFENNLVPQCRDCASIKGSFYFEDGKGCFFLHPMYHDALSKIIFKFDLVFEPNSEQVELTNSKLKLIEKLSDYEKFRVQKHILKLNVKERITTYCQKEFLLLKNKATRHNFPLEKLIAGKICITDTIGKDWESAFYEALNNCEEAKNFLNRKMLNKLLCINTHDVIATN